MLITITHEQLAEEEAERIYLAFRNVFKRIINNENLFDYNHPLKLEDVTDNHALTYKEGIQEDTVVFDYYFKIDGMYYALDISHDPEDFGYNTNYFQEKYSDKQADFYYCQLFSFKDFFDYSEEHETMSFVYDRDTDKIIEILDMSIQGLVIHNSRLIKETSEDNLEKVLK